MDAKTGASHWTYEYASVYKDQFGYNNGPVQRNHGIRLDLMQPVIKFKNSFPVR